MAAGSLVCIYGANQCRPVLFKWLKLRSSQDVRTIIDFIEDRRYSRSLSISQYFRLVSFELQWSDPSWLHRVYPLLKLLYPQAEFTHVFLYSTLDRTIKQYSSPLHLGLPRSLPTALPPPRYLGCGGRRTSLPSELRMRTRSLGRPPRITYQRTPSALPAISRCYGCTNNTFLAIYILYLRGRIFSLNTKALAPVHWSVGRSTKSFAHCTVPALLSWRLTTNRRAYRCGPAGAGMFMTLLYPPKHVSGRCNAQMTVTYGVFEQDTKLISKFGTMYRLSPTFGGTPTMFQPCLSCQNLLQHNLQPIHHKYTSIP